MSLRRAICAACDTRLENDRAAIYIEDYGIPVNLCPHCRAKVKTYENEWNEPCVTREDLATLILEMLPMRKKKKAQPRTDGLHQYFCIMRPPAPGAIPRGAHSVTDFGQRVFIPEIQREAWGFALYDRQLTEDEIWEYDLVNPIIG